ncbi:MAG: hypothetical protein HYU27_00670 [Acidobacteria bacterium]|nr:hypothetical protein [Acidobacteriota bacterium]
MTRVRPSRGGFANVGKGTPEGDGKDKAMRKDSQRCGVELADDKPSSSRTTRERLGTYSGEVNVVVMLARNGRLGNAPLQEETKLKIRQAHGNHCSFVVGDMPGVDSAFIELLDSIGATYTIYYRGAPDRFRVPLALENAGHNQ